MVNRLKERLFGGFRGERFDYGDILQELRRETVALLQIRGSVVGNPGFS